MIDMFRKLLFMGFTIFSVSCTSGKTAAVISPFWEIPDPDLDEIAMIRADPNWGTAVIYNPVTCQEIGEACMFFRRHRYSD